jgi:predicted nucleic acid-binding protein
MRVVLDSECAITGSADDLVTGDAHLLARREERGVPVLSPRALLAALQHAPD